MKKFNYPSEIVKAYKAGEIDDVLLKTHLISFEDIDMWTTDLKDPAVFKYRWAVAANYLEYWELLTEILPDNDPEMSFEWVLGGFIYVCEEEKDLDEITGVDFEWSDNHEGKDPTIKDTVMSWDICEYANNDPASGWGIVLLCTNNSGGNVYSIPSKLWAACNFNEQVKANNVQWQIERKVL